MPKKKTKKKKKGNLFLFIIKKFFILIFKLIFKVIYLLLKFIVKNIKKSKQKSKEKKLEKERPKINPSYEEFEEIEKLTGNLEKFENILLKNKSSIGIIVGARGSGKSAVGLKIIENIRAKTEKKVYVMGFNKEDLPKWINIVEDIEEIENNSFILIDEGGIQFSSRSSMSNINKLLSKMLLISRHKDLSVLLITQNSANLDINAIRQADYLILKPSSLLQKDFERKKIKEVYDEVESSFKKFKGKIGLSYIYSDPYQGFVKNELPSFWNVKISKSFKDNIK